MNQYLSLDDLELEIITRFAKKNNLTVEQAVHQVFSKGLAAKTKEFSPTTELMNKIKTNHNQSALR